MKPTSDCWPSDLVSVGLLTRVFPPDLVGHPCCHYAIRTLMWEAARHSDEDPDRVSFVAALRIARSSLAETGAYSPQDPDGVEQTWRHAIAQLLNRLRPIRR